MVSKRLPEFDKRYEKLDSTVQQLVDKAYEQFKRDPRLVRFEIKLRHKGMPVYAARINDFYRALAFVQEDVALWFWVGPNTEYEALLKRLA